METFKKRVKNLKLIKYNKNNKKNKKNKKNKNEINNNIEKDLLEKKMLNKKISDLNKEILDLEKIKIGIDIGGRHIGVAIVDNTEVISLKNIYILEENRKKENIIPFIKENILNAINEILNENKKNKSDISEVGISAPGDVTDTHIIKSSNLNIYDFDIYTFLKENFGNIEIKVKNDAKAAALAEKKYGVLKEDKDIIFLNIGTGIGSAIFLNNELLKPSMANGFEIGHMLIELNGRECNCGKKGCFERYSSITALREQISKVVTLENKHYNLGSLMEIAEKNIDAKKVFDEYLEILTDVLISLTDIFYPETICFGGSFSKYDNTYIFSEIRKKFEKKKRFGSFPKPNIKAAEFKNEAGIIGSLI